MHFAPISILPPVLHIYRSPRCLGKTYCEVWSIRCMAGGVGRSGGCKTGRVYHIISHFLFSERYHVFPWKCRYIYFHGSFIYYHGSTLKLPWLVEEVEASTNSHQLKLSQPLPATRAHRFQLVPPASNYFHGFKMKIGFTSLP